MVIGGANLGKILLLRCRDGVHRGRHGVGRGVTGSCHVNKGGQARLRFGDWPIGFLGGLLCAFARGAVRHASSLAFLGCILAMYEIGLRTAKGRAWVTRGEAARAYRYRCRIGKRGCGGGGRVGVGGRAAGLCYVVCGAAKTAVERGTPWDYE